MKKNAFTLRVLAVALFIILTGIFINMDTTSTEAKIARVETVDGTISYWDINKSRPKEVSKPDEEPGGRTLIVELAGVENGVLKLNGPIKEEHGDMVIAARKLFVVLGIEKEMHLYTGSRMDNCDHETRIILSATN
jgi:hypothetical protein